MDHIYDLLEALKNEGSTKAKVELMKKFGNPELFKQVCLWTYSYSITFGIKAIPHHEPDGTDSIESAFHLLERLSKRELTGNAAIGAFQQTLNQMTHEDAFVLVKIIERDLGVGVGPKLINKAFPKLIPIFELMACHTLNEDTRHHLEGKSFYVQLKYDAARVCVVVKGGLVTYFTRNGLNYNLENPVLDRAFINAAASYGSDCVFDGEMYQMDDLGNPLSRKVSNGVATKLIKGTASRTEHLNAFIICWDIVPLQAFEAGKHDCTYDSRFETLGQILPDSMVAESTEVSTIEEARQIARKYMDQGQEGIIAKSKAGIWERARVYHCLKVKAEIVSTMKIIGFEEGSGKNEGSLGNLILASSDGIVTTGCGIFKGFEESIRSEIWGDQDGYLGKLVDVLHNGIIQDDKGQYSIYLARVIEFRHDADEADNFEKIKNAT